MCRLWLGRLEADLSMHMVRPGLADLLSLPSCRQRCRFVVPPLCAAPLVAGGTQAAGAEGQAKGSSAENRDTVVCVSLATVGLEHQTA